ncbi:hypothetical protein LBMAG56_41840 [Verrucomicrobiota bacterium]|nr:hypothetical protein LBMAG56_41840 [Verrucomicrobiota bacterium]
MNCPIASHVSERRALLGSMGRGRFVPSNARRSSEGPSPPAPFVFAHRSSATFYLLFLLLLGVAPLANARINVTSLPGRDSVQLTIYNSADLTLVKETRLLTFRKGLNKLEFSWANTLIDPTSVEFRALTRPDEIEILDVSFPPRVTNTLEWRIQSGFAGEVTVEIRYFTSGISWSADYVAEVNQPEKLMQLAGNVRVNNNSGEDYENAAVRLVVGTIRLVENIGDLARRGQVLNKELASRLRSDGSLGTVYNVLNSDFGAFNGRMAGGAGGGAVGKEQKLREVVKEALSEYFLYSVEGRDTIPTGWSKRLPSFNTPAVPLVSLYKFETEQWGASVMRFYAFTNNTASKLGKEPLPDGAVRAYRTVTDDRLFAYVGATAVKYIPINERVEMDLGPDPGVLVKPTLMNWEKTNLAFDASGNVSGWTTKATWEIELQNSRDIDIMLDVRRNFSGDWSLETQTPFEKMDANKVKFLLPLQPREKQKLTYILTTRHGTSATR